MNSSHQDDPHWDWQHAPEVRTAIRPAIATEAQTAVFLSEQGTSLTPDANNLFVDAVAGNLYGAFLRLESAARGNYAPDDTLDTFPQYEGTAEPARRLGVKACSRLGRKQSSQRQAHSTDGRRCSMRPMNIFRMP
jgi:hypothetical protein